MELAVPQKQITTKTPIKYWGGKQLLAPKIVPLIPAHKCYCEPFFGGGAIFFAKPQSAVEIINDINANIINFYSVVKNADTFERLRKKIDVTLYSEYHYNEAKAIWKSGAGDDVTRAWAMFVMSRQCFSCKLGDTWAHKDQENFAVYFDNAKKNFDDKYLRRLEYTQIFCRDALRVIKNTNHADTFFFIDPPYYNADMGHYDGYTLDDFRALLELLSELKGKFLLTTYPSEILTEYTAKNDWRTISNEMSLQVSKTAGKTKKEVFTMNYDPAVVGKVDIFTKNQKHGDSLL